MRLLGVLRLQNCVTAAHLWATLDVLSYHNQFPLGQSVGPSIYLLFMLDLLHYNKEKVHCLCKKPWSPIRS